VCDSVVATGEATADGAVVIAKNSDREPGEAQAVELVAEMRHAPGARTRCTYIDVPAPLRTRAALLCRPHWMWGAEMGANACGLVVANEAVFTRAPREPVALLGMDLVRLTLERAETAEEGTCVLTSLLEEHGQGGPAGHRDKRFRYDSSFLLADPEDAWVVETAGRVWASKRVRGVRAISNGLTLRDDWDRASDGLAARARDWGLERARGRLDFATTFGDPLMTAAAAAVRRRSCTESYFERRLRSISPLDAMRALRQHAGKPGRGVLMSVCAHASWWPTRRAAQTTGSLVSHLRRDQPLHWVTATAAPCTSVFKPVWFDAGLPDLGPTPRDRFDARSVWWRHERLHRRALGDLERFLERFAPARDALEESLVARAKAIPIATAAERAALSRESFELAQRLEDAWFDELSERPPSGRLHREFWRRVDRRSGLAR
jgi:secernin